MTNRTNPMTTDTMLKLATRCEQATGPDRELDEQFALAAGYSLVMPASNERLPGIERWVSPDGKRNGWVRGTLSFPPHYTASLDAAMTLVPEGHDVQVHLFFGRDGEGSAIVSRLKEIGQPRIFAATPALALCAAALRARSA